MTRIIAWALACIALVGIAAAACPPVVDAQDTAAFLQEIPDLNNELSTCPIALPGIVRTLYRNTNTQVNVGSQSFGLTTRSGQVTAVSRSPPPAPNYLVTISQADFDTFLSSSNRASTFAWLFANKRVTIQPQRFISRVRFFFLRPVARFGASRIAAPPVARPAPAPVAVAGGKPDNCDETYIPGHRGYAENKAQWDAWTAQTDGACQSQYGRGIPAPCVHTTQLSVSGNPYYLCWYNN